MNIIGPDALVFAVAQFKESCQFLKDYGLQETYLSETKAIYSALDGTAIEVHDEKNCDLPAALATGSFLRQQVYGVVDQAALDDIYQNLSQDRTVQINSDGTLETVDESGFALKFQISIRKELNLAPEKINSPGAKPQRAANETAVTALTTPLPRTLSHIVLFVPDVKKANDFYCNRLGFRVSDILQDAGSFLRPKVNDDHHTLLLIQTPPEAQGIDHFAFHLAGPNELMIAGSRFTELGYTTYWGPGRHIFGSNWFWYFNSPLGCHVEYDADMDKHDDHWVPRTSRYANDTTQRFLLKYSERVLP